MLPWLVPQTLAKVAPEGSWVVGRDVVQVASLTELDNLLHPADIVMYDLERWQKTPLEEQRDPLSAMRRFADEVRERGMQSILAPSRSLTRATAESRPQSGETTDEAFIRCRFASVPGDYLLLQAQRLACDIPRFTKFVRGAREQASANLIVELSVVPSWLGVECLETAVAAAAPMADGFALWAGEGTPDHRPMREQLELAAIFLSRLRER
jgi:hypothetical protein